MLLKDYLISKETIKLHAHAADWKEAVKLSTDLLIQADAIEPRYYDEILKTVADYGPYFVIAPGIAMPHARPECGVKQTSYSLVTLENSVEFGNKDNDPVDIILTIAAVDKKSLNEETIVQVMTLFDSDDNVANIKRAENITQIKNLLESIDFSAE